MNLDRRLLYNFATNPLRRYSDNFEIIETGNPFLFKLEGERYSVHISYIHDSGNARTNEDEARIQIGRNRINQQIENRRNGYKTYYIGFFNTGDVFTAWDPEKVEVVSATTITSLYARKSDEEKALEHGVSLRFENARNLRRPARHPTLPVSALGFYLQNSIFFHRVPDNENEQTQTNNLIRLLTERPDFWDESSRFTTPNQTAEINREKVTFIVSRTGYRRNPRFAKEVREAYNDSCSICRKQLGLVEAAHIIPHNHEKSVDHVSNGIALCVEHHRLYDDVLILIDIDGSLTVNDDRLKFLEELNLLNGIENIYEQVKVKYKIPDEISLQPNNDFIILGKSIRLGK